MKPFSTRLVLLLIVLAGPMEAPAQKAPATKEIFASWYDVPAHSLARRRAAINEFTAAHNRLPLGTLVRVTRVTDGQSVVVRITDRGLGRTRAKIDLCREAAEQLGMIHDGITRVRLEILPSRTAGMSKPDLTASNKQ